MSEYERAARHDADRTVKAVFLLWLAWVLFCLLLLAGVVYAAVHFISKLW